MPPKRNPLTDPLPQEHVNYRGMRRAFGDLLSDWQHVRMLCTGVAAHGGPFSQASIVEVLHKKLRTHDRILESYTALQSLLSWNRRALNRAHSRATAAVRPQRRRQRVRRPQSEAHADAARVARRAASPRARARQENFLA